MLESSAFVNTGLHVPPSAASRARKRRLSLGTRSSWYRSLTILMYASSLVPSLFSLARVRGGKESGEVIFVP